MTERRAETKKVSKERARQVQQLYQARLTLSAIQGGGAMAPTQLEIEAANKVILETKDEDVKLAAQEKIEIAHNVVNFTTGWLLYARSLRKSPR